MFKDRFHDNLSAFLVISCVSIISHTVLTVPPTLIFAMLMLILYVIIYPLTKHSFYIPKVSIYFILFSIYLFVSQLFLGISFRYIVGLSFAPLYFVLSMHILKRVSFNRISILIDYMIYISVLIFIIELIYRITHPAELSTAITNGVISEYYKYKASGLMYIETNGLAIHILVIFFFLIWWSYFTNKKYLLCKLALAICLYFTFSRAAVLSTVIGFIFFYSFRKVDIRRFYYYALVCIPFVLFLLLAVFIPYFIADPSFSEKIDIFYKFKEYYGKADFLSLLFGVGNYQSIKTLGIYAHNLPLVYLVETGLIGLLLLSTLIYKVVRKAPQFMFVLIPFLVQVMSSTTIFIPHFYVVMAIFYHFTYGKYNLLKSRNLK